jgi:hypothetical protein
MKCTFDITTLDSSLWIMDAIIPIEQVVVEFEPLGDGMKNMHAAEDKLDDVMKERGEDYQVLYWYWSHD